MGLAYETSIPWNRSKAKNVDGVIYVSEARNVPADSWLKRESWKAVQNSTLGLEALKHPQHPFLMTLGQGFMITNGGAIYEKWWNPGEFNYDADTFTIHEQLIQAEIKDGNGHFEYTEIDLDAGYARSELYSSDNRHYWTAYTHSHEVITNEWKMTVMAGSNVCCMVRIDETDPLALKTETLDIAPNSTVTVDRPPAASLCYLICSDEVNAAQQPLESGTAYKLESPHIVLEAGPAGCKVMRVYK